jgi:hypothetical protein
MHRIGISVYPEHSTEDKDYAYMKIAAKYGFSRVFTCLLSVKESREDIICRFTKFIRSAHELGFVVGVDTNPKFFLKLGATPGNLKPFAEMGVDILRLDGHFSDGEDILLTHNAYGLMIEYNASSIIGMDLMLERGADKQNMVMCHNFYPQQYTGLSWNRFMEFTNRYTEFGFSVSAFVSSNNNNTFGPWEVYDGLVTCEIHRGMPIDLQMRHLLATGKIDDIIIGNAYATEAELKEMSKVDKTKITLKLNVAEDVTKAEKDIIFNDVHFDRVDASEYMIRSSVLREKYKNIEIPHRKCEQKEFLPGDVLIVNNNLQHYRGELQIVKKPIRNNGQRNLVGKMADEEWLLMDFLKPEYLFGIYKS